jgi:DNA primase
MARIPEEEIERLKREISVERLVTLRGITLLRHGADLIGTCPFHADKTPSLVVSPEKNLWHCLGACQMGGSAIDWVMKTEGLSFRHAVEFLRSGGSASAASSTPSNESSGPLRKTTAKRIHDTSLRGADMQGTLQRVVGYYHATLKESPEALSYLQQRGLVHPEVITHFKLGFSNRTLGYRIPNKNRKEGSEVRGRLIELGILRETGHEHFNGSLVIPILDTEGNVTSVYGRKITPNLREGTPEHLYLPGAKRAVWNAAALGEEVILCESLIDALTFWCAGYRNVTCSYGVEGFTEAHWQALRDKRVKRVRIAYDRDDAGDKASEKLAAELNAAGIETYRVLFPKGMDANEYACKVQPAAQSLGLALRKAEWLGKGKAPASVVVEAATPPSSLPFLAADSDAPPAPGDAAVVPETSHVSVACSASASTNASSAPATDLARERVYRFGERFWRVRSIDGKASVGQLRVNLLVRRGEGAFFVDTVELYSSRHRAAFLRAASEELEVEERIIKKELGDILLALENELEAAEKAKGEAAKKEKAGGAMTEARREAALSLLRSPALLERIASDLTRCGLVGEDDNKSLAYLAVTSRKLEAPLAVVVQSTSAAGKSSLMEAVLAFVPEEERVQYSAMTGQSLYYMGEEDLKHKVLAIAEEEGASRASYALKVLQSEGSLTIASTGKDPVSGKLVTHAYRVEGPVMIFLTTTAIDVDEELLSRCLVLTVDEGQHQTRAIHAQQRASQTLEGLLEKRARGGLRQLHQDAQRLLEPLLVANPFASTLSFVNHATRTRRDHMKYLMLIRTIALLHQHQREIKTVAGAEGERARYIEVTEADIAMADRLMAPVLGRSLDELPPVTRRLLEQLSSWVAARAAEAGVEARDYRFSRREVREAFQWSQTQLVVHLQRLEAHEHVVTARVSGPSGQRVLYSLCNLVPSSATARAYDGEVSGQNGKVSGGYRPLVGATIGGVSVGPPIASEALGGVQNGHGVHLHGATARPNGISQYGAVARAETS